MRTVELMNSKGDILDLTTTKLFLSGLSGFGYSKDPTYRQIGTRWIIVNDVTSQGTPSGTILFLDENPYAQYREFSVFCSLSPLTLLYTPDDKTYKRQVILTELTKSERDATYGILACNITFTALGPWYESVEISVDESTKELGGWIWSPTDSTITWPVTFGFDAAQEISVEYDGNLPSPCRLTIYGPMTNPHWTHYVNDIEVASGEVTYTVGSGKHLVVDNISYPYSMAVYDNKNVLVADVYQKSDFSTERFINFQNGKNRIVVTGGRTEFAKFTLETNLSYDTV